MATKKSGRKITEKKLDDFDEWFGSLHGKVEKKPSTVEYISKALDVVEGTDEDRSNGSRTKKRKPSAPNHLGTVDKLLNGQSIMASATRERAVQARARRALKTENLKSSPEHSMARRRCTRESLDRVLQDFAGDVMETTSSRHSRSIAKDSTMDASGHRRRRSRDRLGASQHASSHSRQRARDMLSSSQHGKASEIPEVSPSIDRTKRSVGRDDMGSSSHHGSLPRRRQSSSNHDRTDQSSNCTPDDGFGEIISHNKLHLGTERSSPQASPATSSQSPTERRRRDAVPFVSPRGSDTELLAKLKITQSPYDKDKVIVEMDKDTLLRILCGRQGAPTEKKETRSQGSKGAAARLPLPPLCRQSNHASAERKHQSTTNHKRSVDAPF